MSSSWAAWLRDWDTQPFQLATKTGWDAFVNSPARPRPPDLTAPVMVRSPRVAAETDRRDLPDASGYPALELNEGQPPERGLPSVAMVCPFEYDLDATASKAQVNCQMKI